MPMMVYDIEGTCVLLVHRAVPPTDEEWAAYVATVRRLGLDTLRYIVFTDGGAPTTAQRKEAPELFEGRNLLGIVSASAMVRGIATAMGFTNNKIKAFTPEEIHLAFQHIGIEDVEEIERARRTVGGLRVKLGDPSLQCIPSSSSTPGS